MHFTLPFIALAASVSASNPIEAAWNVTRSYHDVSQQVVTFQITAVFVYSVTCDLDTFSVDPQRNGYTLKIQQTIEKPTEQVAYGEGEVPHQRHAVIPVNARVV
ncbi:hypothetical protein G6011_08309 [Alternaria panax]|uniref:Uncharacterized protein n=1 Tax=Alternaria panax TaxID=48097 RepID=A0AAD4FIG7_9PLEO|nr:hypothetical protein G6011_08309 [Alternaria panax]